MAIWQRYLDDNPRYLARHYWWAYLWRPAIWFFDRPLVTNAVLFGRYSVLTRAASHTCGDQRDHRPLLQLSCAYGSLTDTLLRATRSEIHLADAAIAQLRLARRKLDSTDRMRLMIVRMNAEHLAYRDDAFGTILIFFLLHELPPEARKQVLRESIRVLHPGGRLLIGEYAEMPAAHWLYRCRLTRWFLTRLEPFLEEFWQEDLEQSLQTQACKNDKRVCRVEDHRFFNGFYRLTVFEVDSIPPLSSA